MNAVKDLITQHWPHACKDRACLCRLRHYTTPDPPESNRCRKKYVTYRLPMADKNASFRQKRAPENDPISKYLRTTESCPGEGEPERRGASDTGEKRKIAGES